MTPTPLLIIGDGPSLKTGLARIGRDLASLTAQLPEFRVGYLGRGGLGSRQLPFAQYFMHESDLWGNENMMDYVWRDFAGDKPGIIFAIWDASRLGWLSCGDWIARRRETVKLWNYCPVDSVGPGGVLTRAERLTLMGFDRILAYGEYGAEVLTKTVGAGVDWLPHGINADVFVPRDKVASRAGMFGANDKVMGMVATNQARKDWGLAAQVLAKLPDWKAWWHIDTGVRHWDIDELIAAYGLQNRIKVTIAGSLSDSDMSYFYSMCDVTILPSAEGWGFPIAEALSCGVPVIHAPGGGDWGLPTVRIIRPISQHLEGIHNRFRPTFAVKDWVRAIESWPRPSAEECRESVKHLDWAGTLWTGRWAKWIKAGLCS